MELSEQIKRANEINDKLDAITKQKEELDAQEKILTTEKESIYSKLLTYCKDNSVNEQQIDGLFLNYFSKSEVTWLDDVGLLAKLKAEHLKEYIKVTIKESVDKTALKKALKTDVKLAETCKPFYGDKLTEYVTVTTTENHQKMLEHINESKKK